MSWGNLFTVENIPLLIVVAGVFVFYTWLWWGQYHGYRD